MNGVQILAIIVAGIAVSAVAHRRDLQPGVFIVILAGAASFIPGMPRLELDGELILALVVPPLLYSGARGASVTGFGTNLRAIISLGLTLVVLTAGLLGLVASWLLPGIGLAAAFLLGAVLAPPDTITTVSHGDEIGMPRRVTTILTGESLVNDATALTLFSLALAAVEGEDPTVRGGIGEFLYKAVVGLVVGGLLCTVTLLVRPRLHNSTLETSLVLLVPFMAYLAAEELHASGIIAVVAAAFLITANISLDPRHQYPGAYRTRLQEDALWPVVDFLLETFVFAYIGLQLKFVLEDLAASDDPGLVPTLVAGGVLLVVAILFRIGMVQLLFGRFTLRYRRIARAIENDPRVARLWQQRVEEREERRRKRRAEMLSQEDRPAAPGSPATDSPPTIALDEPATPRETFLVGWTGMRGILTLAAAAGVPATLPSGAPFPGRDAIPAIALIVTIGTLLIQGTTMRWMIAALGLDISAERAEAAERLDRGRLIASAALADGAGRARTDADFDTQREAVRTAMVDGDLDEEMARRLIADLDLQQAADRTTH